MKRTMHLERQINNIVHQKCGGEVLGHCGIGPYKYFQNSEHSEVCNLLRPIGHTASRYVA